MQPLFFRNPGELRQWLEESHASAQELWVGLRKKGSAEPTITWPELVDEVLCFGWIDGVRRTLDEGSYVIRISPRNALSTWRKVNTRRAEELIRLGLMMPAGRAAFERRDAQKSGQDSFERETAVLDPEQEAAFRANPVAWEFYRSQPPSYRRLAAWWMISARREDTRLRRLVSLIEDSACGRRIAAALPGGNKR